MSNPDVIVVGAGLAGLACTRALVRGRVKVLLLEAGDAPGGRVRTVADPLRRPLVAVSHLFNPVGTFGDKLRVLELRQLALSGELEDVWHRPQRTSLRYLEDLGFTEEMVEAFLRPFFAGIFLERELGTSSRFLEFVFRMFSTGATVVPEQGMGAIPGQLAAGLPSGVLRMRAPVGDVWGHRVRLADGETIGAKAVVVATDPGSAAGLLPGMLAPRMNRVTCLYFAAPEPPVEGPWLVLNGEGRGLVNNVAVMSEVSPAYAPKGQALVSVSVLEMPLDGEALESRVRAELTEWFGGAVGAWRHLRTYSLPAALPAQPPDALEPPRRTVRLSPGLYVCGDHRDNASIDGALGSGRRAAEAVLMDLGR